MLIPRHLEVGDNSRRTEPDYSTYPLSRLFMARYWVDTRGRLLEEEIQKRCTHISQRINRPFAVAMSHDRFIPYGFIFGSLLLLFSVGPFFGLMLLDVIKLLSDVDRDHVGLAGVWALITVPVMLIVFVIGTVTDAERIVKWFNLQGRS